jgi:predicted RNase H-like HicB family nuclease
MKIAISIRQTAPGRFRADCAAMPGCVAVGQTQEQTCENMRQEIACYVASMDGICPPQLDLVVAVSIGPGERAEPELPVETAPPLGVRRELLLPTNPARGATR